MKHLAIAILGFAFSSVGASSELSPIVGHYRYEQYAVTLANGRILQLKDLGATEAFLDISETQLTLHMTLSRGDMVQSAKILEAHLDKGSGYWKAQWPDMKSPVRANISLAGDVLTSDTKFDNPADPQYGSTEHAVLKRIVSRP